MADGQWSGSDVINLLEKGALLLVQLVKVWKTPSMTLKKITDLTQRLREGEADIDRQVDSLYRGRDTEE